MARQRGNGYLRGSEEFSRLVNFSDGVMAIAITLLVLNIDLPVPTNDAAATATRIQTLLLHLAPQLSAFLVSFVIVAYLWVGHHRLLAGLTRLDTAFVQWNFAFLLLVVLVPLQAQLIGLYSDNPAAIGLYSLGFALLFAWDLLGVQLAWRRGLMAHRPSLRRRRHATWAKLLPVGVFLLTIPAVQWLGTAIANWLWLSIFALESLLDRAMGIDSGRSPSLDACRSRGVCDDR